MLFVVHPGYCNASYRSNGAYCHRLRKQAFYLNQGNALTKRMNSANAGTANFRAGRGGGGRVPRSRAHSTPIPLPSLSFYLCKVSTVVTEGPEPAPSRLWQESPCGRGASGQLRGPRRVHTAAETVADTRPSYHPSLPLAACLPELQPPSHCSILH